jgi:hypothetical protein
MSIPSIIVASLKGAILALILMAISIGVMIIFKPWIPFSFVLIFWVLSFLIVGVLEAKLLVGSSNPLTDVFKSDILTTVWIITASALIVIIYEYIVQGARAFDFLGTFGILSTYLTFGPSVMILSTFLGSLIYLKLKTDDISKS